MKEQLISLDTAKLAKEKGFPQKIGLRWNRHYYNHLGELDGDVSEYLKRMIKKEDTTGLDSISAPTQSLLQKWLREEHGWHIVLIPVVTMGYTFKIMKVWKKNFDPELEVETPPYNGVDAYDYSDYEEALESGLIEGLKLI